MTSFLIIERNFVSRSLPRRIGKTHRLCRKVSSLILSIPLVRSIRRIHLFPSLSRRVETRIGTIAVFKAMIDDRENAMPKIGTRMFHVVTLDERGELTVDPDEEPTDARRTVRAA